MLSLKETSLVALTTVAVQSLNRVWLLRSHGLQLSRLPCPSLSPWVCSHLCAIQLSHPMLPPPPFALKLSQYQGLFQWVSSLHQVTKVLELEFQYQTGYYKEYSVYFLYDWMLWSPSGQRDSQESSPALQFKSINSLALSLLYGSTLTSVHDYWKNHSFGYMDLGRQSDVSDF